ncbi:MAG TPA: hypothetical protein ENJ23_01225 [Bacteroidetes bacterium]|nr:hypothetical protein [Bacteroidota bacterium]
MKSGKSKKGKTPPASGKLQFRKLALLTWAIILWGCSSVAPRGPQWHKRPDLSRVKTFAVIYRHVALDSLRPFELVILEPDAYSAAEIRTLQLQGKIVLGYLNVGEIERYRSFSGKVKSSWKLGPNPEWPDHDFVDPAKRGWQKILHRYRIQPMLEKGLDGFLLDSVDIASGARFPRLKKAMAALIRRIRRWAPDAAIVANNALFLLDEISDEIDGVLLEEVFFSFDSSGNYAVRPAEEQFARLQRIRSARERVSLPFFLVDYCPENWLEECRQVEEICRANDLVHFCTDRFASRIYAHVYESAKDQTGNGLDD